MAKMDIIVPAYKASGTIDRLLASIYMQTIKDDICVYIVSDADGVDYSNNLFKDKLNLKYLVTPKNGGAGVARQYGVDYSNSEFIVFADKCKGAG